MTALSRLKLAAQYFQAETFLTWDSATDTFSTTSFVGRLYPFDRFKTIYSRPTRRETLGVKESVAVPEGGVIRHNQSGDTFIVTDTERYDVDDDKQYDRAYAIHRARYHGKIVRYQTQGAGDDLGPELYTEIGPVWFDTELRADKQEDEAYHAFRGYYYLTYPITLDVRDDDYLVSDSGEWFRVDEKYIDSGFGLGRGEDVEFLKETFTYSLYTGTGGGYDPSTGVYTPPTTAARDFSGHVRIEKHLSLVDSVSAHASSLRLYVDENSVGFEFKVGGIITRANGDKFKVDEIRQGEDGHDQLRLELRKYT